MSDPKLPHAFVPCPSGTDQCHHVTGKVEPYWCGQPLAAHKPAEGVPDQLAEARALIAEMLIQSPHSEPGSRRCLCRWCKARTFLDGIQPHPPTERKTIEHQGPLLGDGKWTAQSEPAPEKAVKPSAPIDYAEEAKRCVNSCPMDHMRNGLAMAELGINRGGCACSDCITALLERVSGDQREKDAQLCERAPMEKPPYRPGQGYAALAKAIREAK